MEVIFLELAAVLLGRRGPVTASSGRSATYFYYYVYYRALYAGRRLP